MTGEGEALLSQVRASREELFNWIETALLVAGPRPETRVDAGLGALLDWVAAEPAGARALLLESPIANPAVSDLQREAFVEAIDLLRRTVPADSTRPRCVEEVVVGALVSILRTLLVAGESGRAPELRDGVGRFILFSFAQAMPS